LLLNELGTNLREISPNEALIIQLKQKNSPMNWGINPLRQCQEILVGSITEKVSGKRHLIILKDAYEWQ